MFMEYYFQQKRDILAKILHILNIEEFKTPLTKAPEEYGSLTGCYDRLWVTSDVPSWVVVVGGDPGKTRFKKKNPEFSNPGDYLAVVLVTHHCRNSTHQRSYGNKTRCCV